MKPTIDPELKKQLAAAGDDSPVEAVFTLRTPAGKRYLEAAETKETVSRILDDASASTRQQTHALNVMPNLQSFVVAAPPALMREILEHPEVAGATANRQPAAATDTTATESSKRPPPRKARKKKP